MILLEVYSIISRLKLNIARAIENSKLNLHVQWYKQHLCIHYNYKQQLFPQNL